MKEYTIVWMFEIYYVKRFDVVSTISNFKKWLIQEVNKINRKCSADDERIYYWLQVALVYASFGCRIYGVLDSRRGCLYAALEAKVLKMELWEKMYELLFQE